MEDLSAAAARNLGAKLRSLRHGRGLSLADASDEADVSLPYLSEIERGEKLPSLTVLLQIAASYGLTVAELLADVPPFGGAVEPGGER